MIVLVLFESLSQGVRSMKRNPVLTETFEQLIVTAKGTSSQWVKFAKENPLTQKLKARYPEYLKVGRQFVEEQKKEVQKFLSPGKAKSPIKKKDESRTPKTATDEAANSPAGEEGATPST